MCLQDVRVLYNQMSDLDGDESAAPIQTSLDRILASIRSHWEKVMERNRVETDNYLEYKVLQTFKLDYKDYRLIPGIPVTDCYLEYRIQTGSID